MKQNLFNKLWLRVGMIVAIMTTALSGTAWAAEGDEITSVSNIVDGKSYYIKGVRSSNTYYLTFTDATGNQSGTESSTKAGAQLITFHVQSAGVYYLETSSGNYIAPGTSNGKIQVSSTGINVTASNQSSKIRLSIISGNNTWSIQKNNSAANFGGYKNTQTDITLVEGPSSSLTPNDLTLNATSKSFDLADGANQTFQLTNSGSADGALSYESNNTAVATVSNTGLITAVGEGTATITVTQDASSTYQGGTATCTVTVTDSRYTVSDLTFTAQCHGSGTADDNVAWTVASDGTESTYDGTKGIHYGTSSNAVQYITLTTSGINGTIAKIVVNASTANNVTATVGVTVGGVAFGGDAQSLTTSAADHTFTGSASGEIVVTVTKPSSATGALYVKSVKVYYIPSTDPSISADDVDIAYDAIVGSFNYTINNTVDGGTVSVEYDSDDDWLLSATANNGTVNFTCEANNTNAERLALVTITYTYGSPSQTVTKEVWVTQAAAPVIYSTIPALFDKATEVGNTATNVNVTFGGWVVSGVHGSNVFVTDNSGNGFIIYKSENGFAVNDKLSGTVSGTPLKLYNGSAEFTNLTASATGLTVTKDGEITVITNKTIAELGGVNTGAVITLSNLTYDGTNLSDGSNTIKPYNTLYSDMSLTSGKTYNITGVYQQFNTNSGNTKEILPRSADDIVEVADEREDAEIAFSVETLTFTEGDTYTAPTFSNPNNVTVTFSTTNGSVASWNNGLVLGGSTGTATITAAFAGNNDYLPATATLTITINVDINFADVVIGGNVYEKVTDLSQLEAGKRYLIVYENEGGATVFNGKNGTNNYGDYISDVEINDNRIYNTNGQVTHPVVLQSAGSGNWYIMDGEYFLYWSSGNSLYWSNEISTGGNTWSIAVNKITNATTTERRLQYNTGSPRFACYTGTQKDVVLYKEITTVTLNASGYATFSSNNAVSIPADGDFTAWQITKIDSDNKITFVQVTGNVKAETGLFLKGTASAEITIEVAASGEELQDNILVGFPNATNVGANEYYGLSGNQFKKVGAGTVKPGKALLPAGYITESSGVKPFTFIFEEDDATGISLMEDGRSQMEDGVIYNVAGQRISKMQKGINIVNGKKILK